MLFVSNVSKHFGGVKALNNCSLKINENKITGLIGPNGSGKTTLFDIITGLTKNDYGEVFLHYRTNKKDICKIRPSEITNLGIVRTFQHVRLFKNLTIKDHLFMCMNENDLGLFRSLLQINYDSKEKKMKMEEVLNLVGLDKSLDTKVFGLSYGQKKLLELAMAITKPHKLLMLDEPVAGVSPKLRIKIKKILLHLKEKGETIIIIEHDMRFIFGIADHIVVLSEGNVLVEGNPNLIQKDKRVLEAYLGGATC